MSLLEKTLPNKLGIKERVFSSGIGKYSSALIEAIKLQKQPLNIESTSFTEVKDVKKLPEGSRLYSNSTGNIFELRGGKYSGMQFFMKEWIDKNHNTANIPSFYEIGMHAKKILPDSIPNKYIPKDDYIINMKQYPIFFRIFLMLYKIGYPGTLEITNTANGTEVKFVDIGKETTLWGRKENGETIGIRIAYKNIIGMGKGLESIACPIIQIS